MDIPGEGGRKLLVLSDMLELGAIEVQAHHEAGIAAAGAAGSLYACGPLAREYAAGAREAGMKDVHREPDKASLTQALKEALRPGDLVWFKASRGMALEEVIEDLCREEGGGEG